MKFRKFVALVVCLALCLSLIPSDAVWALDDTPEAFRYVSIGDSTTNGYGEPSYYLNGREVRGFLQEVPTAYPALIRDKLAALHPDTPVVLTQLAGSALRPDDLDAILDKDHVNDHYTSRVFAGHNIGHDTSGEEWFKTWANLLDGITVDNCADGEVALRKAFGEAIAEADLITYYLGSNSFGTFLTGALLSDRYGDTDTLQDLLADLNISEEQINVAAVRETILKTAASYLPEDIRMSVDEIDASFGEYIDLFVHGYVGCCVYFVKNITAIRALNPDCDIVVCGLHSYLTGITVETDGMLLDIGGLYGAVLELFNQYMAFCPVNDQYLYADFNAVEVETYADELYNGQLSPVMQDYLDGMIGDMAKGVMSDLAAMDSKAIGKMLRRWAGIGFTDQGGANDFALLAGLAESNGMIDTGTAQSLALIGMTTEQAIKAAWLYRTASDGFTVYMNSILQNSPMSALFVQMTNALTDTHGDPVPFSVYKAKESALSGDTISTMLLTALRSTAESLEGIRAYGRIQDTLLSCVNRQPLDLAATMEALNGGLDLGVIGQEVLAAATGQTPLSESTGLLIKLYFLFMFPDGMGICAHPNINGHKTLADAVWSAYENRTEPEAYMLKKDVDTAIQTANLLMEQLPVPGTVSALTGTADDYDRYVALGGFEAYGYGLFDTQPAAGFGLCHAQSYPALIKSALSIENENFYPLASGYLRAADILHILDADAPTDGYTATVTDPLLTAAFGSVEQARAFYRFALKDADVVTADFGGNGVIAYLSVVLNAVLQGEEAPAINWSGFTGVDTESLAARIQELLRPLLEAESPEAVTDETWFTLAKGVRDLLAAYGSEAISGISDEQILSVLAQVRAFAEEHAEEIRLAMEQLDSARLDLLDTIAENDLEPTLQLIALLGEHLVYYYTTLAYSYAPLLDTLQALSDDAAIVVIGLYNGIDDWYLESNPYNPVPIGHYADAPLCVFNTRLHDYAVDHSDRVCYIDATGVELIKDTLTDRPDGNLLADTDAMNLVLHESGKYTCPSLDGHESLANTIVTLLTAAPVCTHIWDEGITVPATCNTYSHTVYTCTLCQATKEEDGDTYADHLYGDWETATPSTHTQKGTEHRVCEHCLREETRDADLLPYLVGDLDDNGVINDWDAVLLERYLAGWDVSASVVSVLPVLDIDGNGSVTDWDCVLFDRYMAGWNVTSVIGSPIVVA